MTDAVDEITLLQRTHRYTLGEPRSFAISADGSSLLFLRAPGPHEAALSLWHVDVTSGAERLVCDPVALGAGGDDDEAVRQWRERARESAEGITAYCADDAHRTVIFALAGGLWAVDVAAGTAAALPAEGSVSFAAIAPDGSAIAYCTGSDVVVIRREGGRWRPAHRLAGEADVYWGRPEHAGLESIGRTTGLWWSPDSSRLALTRVDETPVQIWHTARADEPWRAPVAVRYRTPATAHGDVRVHVLEVSTGELVPAAAHPYDEGHLIGVRWEADATAWITRQSLDHRSVAVADADTGRVRHATRVDGPWWETFNGLPYWLTESRLPAEPISFAGAPDGELLAVTRREGRFALTRGDAALTGPAVNVRQIHAVDGEEVIFSAAQRDRPAVTRVWRVRGRSAPEPLSPDEGIAYGTGRAGTAVVCHRSLTRHGLEVAVHAADGRVHRIAAFAQDSGVVPNLRILSGVRVPTGVVLPRDHTEGEPLPVLVASYGGTRAQMVVESRQAWIEAQWLADQGFAVLVADGRGTAGNGPHWEYAAYRDAPDGMIADQVEALAAAAAQIPDLDLGRVGIRGWSFGGYLAATAVIRRPDVFHVGVAGVPVTDWRRYAGYYTEALLGDPRDGDAYDRADATWGAAGLRRPLLIVQGMSDDNVFPFHALRLSSALLASGRPHGFLPLSGVAHVAAHTSQLASIMRAEVDFIRAGLAAAGHPAARERGER